MAKGKDLPKVSSKMTLSKTLIEISAKGLGVALVIEGDKLKGIFTDGDLRRTLNDEIDPINKSISLFMTKDSKVIQIGSLAIDALEIMQTNKKKMFVGSCMPMLVGTYFAQCLLKV